MKKTQETKTALFYGATPLVEAETALRDGLDVLILRAPREYFDSRESVGAVALMEKYRGRKLFLAEVPESALAAMKKKPLSSVPAEELYAYAERFRAPSPRSAG